MSPPDLSIRRTPAMSAPQTPLPDGACDSHVHVFDPQRFPYEAKRSYTPGAATATTLQQTHAQAGFTRCVLVQASVYGSDNRCLVDALDTLGPQRSRGVAVLDWQQAPASLSATLNTLHQSGVRSARINLQVRGDMSLSAARAALDSVSALADLPGWSLQLHASHELVAALADDLARLALPLVLDHHAGARAESADLAPLLGLLRQGRSWVKLSAPYRASSRRAPHEDLRALTLRLVDAAPDRVLWGSDWPHTAGDGVRSAGIDTPEAFRDEDSGLTLATLRTWLGDAAWRCMLVDNPARLYGFEPLV